MGEAKRKRATDPTRSQTFELKMIPLKELRGAKYICAWEGCETTHDGPGADGRVPKGWVILYTLNRYLCAKLPDGEPVMRIFSPNVGLQRDAVLCPHHAEAS
jgi:hypothetical protein